MSSMFQSEVEMLITGYLLWAEIHLRNLVILNMFQPITNLLFCFVFFTFKKMAHCN